MHMDEELKKDILKEIEEFQYTEEEVARQARLSFVYMDRDDNNNNILEETSFKYSNEQGYYTINDYLSLPSDSRMELIDGYFFCMSTPNLMHQEIAGEVYRQIADYLD